jgi:hypothetical protein
VEVPILTAEDLHSSTQSQKKYILYLESQLAKLRKQPTGKKKINIPMITINATQITDVLRSLKDDGCECATRAITTAQEIAGKINYIQQLK